MSAEAHVERKLNESGLDLPCLLFIGTDTSVFYYFLTENRVQVDVLVTKSTCYASLSAGVQIPSTHIKAKLWELETDGSQLPFAQPI